jgi:hypothetical protein
MEWKRRCGLEKRPNFRPSIKKKFQPCLLCSKMTIVHKIIFWEDKVTCRRHRMAKKKVRSGENLNISQRKGRRPCRPIWAVITLLWRHVAFPCIILIFSAPPLHTDVIIWGWSCHLKRPDKKEMENVKFCLDRGLEVGVRGHGLPLQRATEHRAVLNRSHQRTYILVQASTIRVLTVAEEITSTVRVDKVLYLLVLLLCESKCQ